MWVNDKLSASEVIGQAQHENMTEVRGDQNLTCSVPVLAFSYLQFDALPSQL